MGKYVTHMSALLLMRCTACGISPQYIDKQEGLDLLYISWVLVSVQGGCA